MTILVDKDTAAMNDGVCAVQMTGEAHRATGNRFRMLLGAALAGIFLHPATAQFVQQGGKLVGTGAVGNMPQQAFSTAISADGNTAIIGAPGDNNNAGAAWVFTRTGGAWSQQSKLIGTGGTSDAEQGWSVGLSGDGNTAIVGGPFDAGQTGAAWVFTRTGATWAQQGNKLVGTGVAGSDPPFQGFAVALSGDGNTALVGGANDNSAVGATWVFTRAGGTWSQQSKLVGTGVAGTFGAEQGSAVALSGDGNTAIVGGNFDGNFAGAAWVFTRNGGVWSQQGNKLVGTGGSADASQGSAVAISGDGNTAIASGPDDNNHAGAVWVFTRAGGVWSQQGNKLVGTGAAGTARQGNSTGLSADGNTAFMGGPNDNNNAGAAWVFTRTGGVWSQQGNKLVGTGGTAGATQGTAGALSGDGSTAIVGGPNDNAGAGAAWVFFAAAAGGNAALSVAKSHTGSFTPGQQGARYTVTVSNGANAGPTTGAVTVTETVPAGLTLISMAGTGWTCPGITCTRSDALNSGASYPPIVVTVNVAANAASPQVNSVAVSGGGSAGASATDSTVIGTGTSRCDLNGDGNVNVGDVQTIINMVLSLIPATPNADLNHDGNVNVADVQILINVVLGGTTCPA